ncbi:PUA domain (predicted RNA-binding domain) [Serratia entomophila]|uniref:phosphoadenosine phosphosulfate reductase domain-containing protein n=1 Tax=Serratia entomophila TaxID=42906 RepID=UPI00217938B2|nr:phosphoadenosine phosphosulfate reductase family protein [Serratia entomophila]CAI0899213.1 PUA domain (predicted RNA-binding domain) [Serratia entomophila]
MPANELKPKEPMVVSVSGGQSSEFMSDFLLQNYADIYEFHFVFANTGREHEETLKFIDRCDKYFGQNVVWLEGVTSPIPGIGMTHKVVNFETAARNGEPFEQLISVKLPSAFFSAGRVSTDELSSVIHQGLWKKTGVMPAPVVVSLHDKKAALASGCAVGDVLEILGIEQ